MFERYALFPHRYNILCQYTLTPISNLYYIVFGLWPLPPIVPIVATTNRKTNFVPNSTQTSHHLGLYHDLYLYLN